MEKAITASGMTIGEISEVILVGAGTRVPKVQEVLLGFLGAERELGKNLNTDEAAAMGAVYKAADLSTGFKVRLLFTVLRAKRATFTILIILSRALE